MSSLSYGNSKGVVDSYQGVVAEPTNSGVNFAARRIRHGACGPVDYWRFTTLLCGNL